MFDNDGTDDGTIGLIRLYGRVEMLEHGRVQLWGDRGGLRGTPIEIVRQIRYNVIKIVELIERSK